MSSSNKTDISPSTETSNMQSHVLENDEMRENSTNDILNSEMEKSSELSEKKSQTNNSTEIRQVSSDTIEINERAQEKKLKPKQKIHITAKDVASKASDHKVIQVGSETVEINLEKESIDDILFYSIEPVNSNFQIKLDIKTKSPLDFGQCAISFNQYQTENCIKSYLQILKSGFMLKVNKALLPDKLNIFVSLVISGCDSETRIRDIDFDGDKTPLIYHNSDHDCIYRVKKSFTLSMLSLIITNFPSKYERVCKALVQIYNSKNKSDIDEGELQASFEDHNSVNAFSQGIFIAHQYAMIKVVNCYENNEPIEIKIDLIKSKRDIV